MVRKKLREVILSYFVHKIVYKEINFCLFALHYKKYIFKQF